MLRELRIDNYHTIQRHIKEAMQQGEQHIYVGKESFAKNFKPDCVCLDLTKERLIDDGFKFEDADFDEWKISW